MKKFSIAITLMILFLFILPLHASASSWTTYKYNSQNNPVVFDSAKNKNSGSYDIQINTNASVPTTPVAANSVLYYAKNLDNPQRAELYAANLGNGLTIWQKDYSRHIFNLFLDQGKLYFGSDAIYCLDLSDGSEIWKQKSDYAGNLIESAKVYRVDAGVVYAGENQRNYPDYRGLLINSATGQNIANLGNLDVTYLKDVLIDNSGLYFVNIGKTGTAGSIAKYDKSSRLKIWGIDIPNGMASFLDTENNRVYVTKGYRLIALNSMDGQKIFDKEGALEDGFVKYGGRIYGFYSRAVRSFDVADSQGNMAGESVFELPEKFSSAPLVVNDTIYGGSSNGRLWGKNLETNEQNIWPVGGSGGYIYYLAYAEGKMLIINRLNQFDTRLFVTDINEISLRPGNYTVTLDSPYKTDGAYNSYLGQLHAHYLPESPLNWALAYGDYLYSSYDVEKRYKDAGYDFVAITEHNRLTPDPGVGGMLHISDGEEDTQGWYGNHILAIGINNPIDETQANQQRIDQILIQGGIPILAHPKESVYKWSEQEIIETYGANIIEGLNSATHKKNPFVDAFGLLDTFPYKLRAIAGDDYTPDLPGFDGGAVVVFSKTKTQADIMQNLKDGNFYALQGSQAPRIGVVVSGNQITINSDKQSKIKFIGNGGKTLQEINDVFSASYIATGSEIYVRVEVEADGKSAWTQPIMVNKTSTSQTLSSGEHYTDLGQAGLVSNTSDNINTLILMSSQYPALSPPLGYLSPVYSFSTFGQVLDGTNLSISYADKSVFTNEDNLAIYTYDEINSVWNRIMGYVDKAQKIVSADLSHFSLYTLSAEQPADTEKPIVFLASPTDLTNLSGQINFEANALDNNAVTETRFFVDDKLIAKDTDISNGWKTEINANDFAVGSHKLKLEAEDFSGNIGIFETNFTIANSTFVAPTISIFAPVEEQYLNKPFTATGAYSSVNDIQSISVYLNDIYITDTEFTSGNFQKEIDFSQFKEGKHILKTVLIDDKNNVVESRVTINAGDELKVNIVSPQNKTYLHSESIMFQYQTIPANAEGVVAKIDGVEIANNATKYAYDLSLGQHKYSVEKNGKVYAELNFSISTSLADQIKLTDIMYKTGHIKNRGITTAIQVRLALAQLFEWLSMENLQNLTIQQTIKFIDQQNKQKKPLIDDYARAILVGDLIYLQN